MQKLAGAPSLSLCALPSAAAFLFHPFSIRLRVQRPPQILVQIRRVLEPARQPQKVVRDAAVGSFHRVPVLHEALDAAQRRRGAPQSEARDDAQRGVLAALDAYGEHPAV
eukprot:22134-Pelagococcus_subviridis.AAC.2